MASLNDLRAHANKHAAKKSLPLTHPSGVKVTVKGMPAVANLEQLKVTVGINGQTVTFPEEEYGAVKGKPKATYDGGARAVEFIVMFAEPVDAEGNTELPPAIANRGESIPANGEVAK